MKKERLSIFKLNNKGDALPIVIVGIFVLSILGTLILGMTATNYRMKVVDKKSADTFYYAEKAVDEIYAGIGGEVMKVARSSYQNVIENFVEDQQDPVDYTRTITTCIDAATAKANFDNYYLNGKVDPLHPSESFSGVTALYPETTLGGSINELIYLRLEGYIELVSGYDIKINRAYTTDTGEETRIVYDRDASGNLTNIYIKNLCVECNTNSGYYSSVVIDFKIDIPEVDFDIVDSFNAVSNNVDDISKYTLVAQGVNIDTGAVTYKPSIYVTQNSKVAIKGNTYSGTGTANNMSKSTDKSALVIASGATLNVEAKDFVCDGPMVVSGGKVDFRSIGGLATPFNSARYNKDDALNLYVTDMVTEGNNSKINAIANVIVEDDLEINGNQSEVAIKGKYFGYGFQAVNNADITVLNNSSIIEADSGTTELGFTSPTLVTGEHELRSAIIINGKRANIDLTGLNTMILGGRAYIDLDSGTQVYGEYMTGESVSIKGNQEMYLAKGELKKEGSKVTANPIDYADLVYKVGGDEYMTYENLGLDFNEVVGKHIGPKLYFYTKKLNPKEQTENFISAYTSDTDKKTKMEERIKDTLAVQNLKFSPSLKYYTVGAFMSVENGNVSVNSQYTGHSGNMSDIEFKNYLKEMIIRKSFLSASLKSLSNIGDTPNRTVYAGTSKVNAYKTVYEKYVANDLSAYSQDNQNMLSGEAETKYVSYNGTTDTIANFVSAITGKTEADAATYHVGFYIDTNEDTGSTSPNLNEGIWITNRSVVLDHNFKGIIISNGSITLSGVDTTVEDSEELIKFMLTCEDPDGYFTNLRNAMNMDTTLEQTSSLGITSSGISYLDVVSKENWRKNTD